ncbi:MAG: hypothetical protein AAF543_08495 [Pseudomonadota bacterium]
MRAAVSQFIRPSCLVAAMVMTGCAISPADRTLASVIKQHYAAHATEEEGACRTPRIDTIQEQRLLERSSDGSEVMMVRYSYFDSHADMDERWDKLVYLSQPCGGISERRFVLIKDDFSYRVTEMSGEHHGDEGIR